MELKENLLVKGNIQIEDNMGMMTPPGSKLEVNLQNSQGWSGLLEALRIISPDSRYWMSLFTQVIASGNTGYVFRTSDNGRLRDALTIDTIGNVGIGTTSPISKLDIKAGNLRLSRAGDTFGYVFQNYNNGVLLNIGYMTDNDANWYNGSPIMTMHYCGNVGIGTVNPQSRLDVAGDISVTGDVKLVGGDCAEDFDVVDAESVQPGTVMVIDREGVLRPSAHAYDKRVAGVVSGAGDLRPGITLDKHNEKTNRLPLALTGKVYCKVDAQYGPVDVGDLLTTSPTYGHAMKATDPGRAFGTVIGKALRELTEGTGLIPILVALQ